MEPRDWPLSCQTGMQWWHRIRDLIGSRRWRQVWQSAIVNRAKRPDRRHLIATGRHPTRRDGAIALVLFLLPWAALALVRRHHLDAGTMAAVVFGLAAVSIGLPTLWVTWAAYRDTRRSGTQVSGVTMAEVADRLAVAVGTQWENEAAARRLNDPWPLPVSWAAADPSLTDAWDSLERLATSGAGWPASSLRATWASGPEDLAGMGGELADVLARVPTGRLVVLGEPGAGKTVLMVRLVLDLLAHREPGAPVPFLASAASWDPSVQDLRGWLAARLLIDHPALAALSPGDVTDSTQAAALLASGLILPVLDGLDEIPERVRGPAISRINDALRPGEQLVVTCRTEQYRDAVRPQGGLEVTLRAAAAVQLRPLDADAVRHYLSDDAAGPAARARWAPVLAVLGTEAPAAQALGAPLMVGLARAIYNPRPGEQARTLRDPAELCNPALPDRRAVESLLFDAFIPAAYTSSTAGPWTAQQAETWLVFLARHLEQTIGSPDLAWWQMQEAVPRKVRAADVSRLGYVFGLLFLLAVAGVGGIAGGTTSGGSAGVPGSSRVGSGVGLSVFAGVIVLFGIRLRARHAAKVGSAKAPARGMRISVPGLVVAFLSGLLAWIAWGLAPDRVAGIGVPGDLARATSPRTLLARDRQVALRLTLAGGLAYGLAAGLAFLYVGWILLGITFGFAVGLMTGAAAGLVFGLGQSIGQTAWPWYMLTRGRLALHHRLPWPLMNFLADAHQRGVLRQAGAVYQFRHIELQHRLANRDADKQRTNTSAAPPAASA
jgi:NACHT domain